MPTYARETAHRRRAARSGASSVQYFTTRSPGVREPFPPGPRGFGPQQVCESVVGQLTCGLFYYSLRKATHHQEFLLSFAFFEHNLLCSATTDDSGITYRLPPPLRERLCLSNTVRMEDTLVCYEANKAPPRRMSPGWDRIGEWLHNTENLKIACCSSIDCSKHGINGHSVLPVRRTSPLLASLASPEQHGDRHWDDSPPRPTGAISYHGLPVLGRSGYRPY